MNIPIYYDPMLAKLIAFADTREHAINRLVRAIDEYKITGVKTTLSFGKFVLLHPDFISGNFDTHFVGKHFSPDKLLEQNDEEALVAAIVAAKFATVDSTKQTTTAVAAAPSSKWRNRAL
jgi:acetyl/propionyl-CoA carboxylase alpha subunit